MIDATFWEVGASGWRYSREYVINTLLERCKNPPKEKWEAKDFHCIEIARDNYLVTYTLIQGEQVTRRSTTWRCFDKNWKIVYHQGTIVKE